MDDSDGCCQVRKQEAKHEQGNKKSAGQVREQQKSECALSKRGHWWQAWRMQCSKLTGAEAQTAGGVCERGGRKEEGSSQMVFPFPLESG